MHFIQVTFILKGEEKLQCALSSFHVEDMKSQFIRGGCETISSFEFVSIFLRSRQSYTKIWKRRTYSTFVTC